VLIQGESGVGKELVARQLHRSSTRRDGPFVPVDCTTLTDTLFESQLFGHVKGAFTGAEHPTQGFFRAAHGGTLFLDEVGDLSPGLQKKLLRAIEERAVVPLGAVKAIGVDVRIFAATHRDLADMTRKGTFRGDLFYRLNVAALEISPLRARREDIRLLAEDALSRLAGLYAEPPKALSPAALDALVSHDWPGNVRELFHALEHAHAFSASATIEPSDLPFASRGDARQPFLPLKDVERRHIALALRMAGGVQTAAAQLLGLERHRLRRRIRLHGLEDLIR
jgi:transcriptional regulator with PAS, ATPase and Fis domain